MIFFFSCKFAVGYFVDLEEYDFILYVDSDILFNGSDISEIFENKGVVCEFHNFSVKKNLKGLYSVLTDSEKLKSETIKSWSGACVGVPKGMYTFYNVYRDAYHNYLHKIPHDQPALNLAIFRNMEKYSPIRLENKKYWTHYWGGTGHSRKSRMPIDYKILISK
jgi:hypothetical protein